MPAPDIAKALRKAAAEGDEPGLRQLLDAGAAVDTPLRETTGVDRQTYEQIRTPLLVAAGGGHEAAALLLIERGANVNARDTFTGATALVEAARTGLVALVAALLQRGARPDARDAYHDMTALAAAARAGHVEVVRRLLTAGAPYDARALIEACHYGRHAVVDVLFAAGHDPRSTWKHQTALRAAAGAGQTQLVERLLGFGAYDVGAITDALHAAAGAGHTDTVGLLCARGARVNDRDGAGWTALIAAAWQGHVDTVRALLSAGADRSADDRTGKTAIDWARKGKRDDVARLLAGS